VWKYFKLITLYIVLEPKPAYTIIILFLRVKRFKLSLLGRRIGIKEKKNHTSKGNYYNTVVLFRVVIFLYIFINRITYIPLGETIEGYAE